ncbi:MAG: hypothetical protein HY736_26770 [Verrucomicrobia bacterium]|nr:hypothetical protein [Verrucomicrobiota bacterium]
MKTIPLRQLVREPIKVKHWTRGGQTVRVTDDGEPLWLIQRDPEEPGHEARKEAVERELGELLRQPKSPVSLSQLIQDSRR